MQPNTVYLDVDDTLLEWTEEMLFRLCGSRDISGIHTHFDPSLFGGATVADVSRVMESVDFWYSLRMGETGAKILEALKGLEQDVILVTAIPPATASLKARRAALEAKGALSARFKLPVCLISDSGNMESWKATKALLASSSKLLVDDSESACRAFSEAGGQSILVPRPWNSSTADPASLIDWLCNPIPGVDIPARRLRAETERYQAAQA